jgi:hypothetical protein
VRSSPTRRGPRRIVSFWARRNAVQLRGRTSSEALRSIRRQPASQRAMLPWAPGAQPTQSSLTRNARML